MKNKQIKAFPTATSFACLFTFIALTTSFASEKPPKSMDRKAKPQTKSQSVKRHPSQKTLQPVAHN